MIRQMLFDACSPDWGFIERLCEDIQSKAEFLLSIFGISPFGPLALHPSRTLKSEFSQIGVLEKGNALP